MLVAGMAVRGGADGNVGCSRLAPCCECRLMLHSDVQ